MKLTRTSPGCYITTIGADAVKVWRFRPLPNKPDTRWVAFYCDKYNTDVPEHEVVVRADGTKYYPRIQICLHRRLTSVKECLAKLEEETLVATTASV